MRIAKKLIGFGLCLCLTGCAAGNLADKNQEAGIEEGQNYMITSGDMYEITENNFVKGTEHQFTEDELKIWNKIIEKNAFVKKVGTVSEKNIQYMIHLYDSKENEVAEYMMDKDGKLYDGKQKGTEVYNQEIMDMLQNTVS